MSDEDDLRDRFAAAALTGLTHPEDGQAGPLRMELVCTMAYRWADAMLRERAKTNHDAAPAARARTNAAGISRQGTGETPVTEPMPKEKRAEVSVRIDGDHHFSPVAWAVVYPNDEVAVIAFKRGDADERASASDRVVPLYRHLSPALTDDELEAVTWFGQFENHGLSRGRQRSAVLRGLLERHK